MINIDEFWANVSTELSISMNTLHYQLWIEHLEPVCFINNSLVLMTITEMAKRTIDAKYRDVIKEVANSINSFVDDIIIITPDKKDEFLSKQNIFIENKGFVTKKPVKDISDIRHCQFLEKFTFENFVEGASNSFALAACKTVAENPGGKYNPLFIYSGVGLGKTHLLHSIGNYIFKNSPKTSVLYVSTESLVNDLISVFRTGSNEKNNEFREKYRSCDILMVDDIQYLIGKDAIQNAFFNIFNDLYHQNKQIILTSDRAPKDLTTLEDRLRTRFSWGLMVDIQPPDLELRVAILKNKADQANFDLSDEVALFIAEHAQTNIRELEGFLNKIIFYSSLTNTVIRTKELAYEAISDFIEDKKDTVEACDIIDCVSKYFNISQQDLFAKKRTKGVVEPRMIAIYLITELLPMPLSQIGELFGGRDHTTIIHARDKISEEIKVNPRMRIIVTDIKNMILNK